MVEGLLFPRESSLSEREAVYLASPGRQPLLTHELWLKRNKAPDLELPTWIKARRGGD